MRQVSKEPLHAVHDDDLQDYLAKLGILGDLRRGIVHCAICRAALSLSNLYALFPRGGQVKLVCDMPECVERLNGLVRAGEISA